MKSYDSYFVYFFKYLKRYVLQFAQNVDDNHAKHAKILCFFYDFF